MAEEKEVLNSVLSARDHFETLGFPCYSPTRSIPSNEEFRRAYLQRSRACHPDKNKDPRSTQAFQKLATAFQVLFDDTKRNSYLAYLQTSTRPSAPQQQKEVFGKMEVVEVAVALALFARIATQLAGPLIEKNMFHHASDAVALADLFLKSQKQRGEGRESRAEVQDGLFSLRSLSHGLLVAGTVVSVVSQFSKLLSKNEDTKEETKSAKK